MLTFNNENSELDSHHQIRSTSTAERAATGRPIHVSRLALWCLLYALLVSTTLSGCMYFREALQPIRLSASYTPAENPIDSDARMIEVVSKEKSKISKRHRIRVQAEMLKLHPKQVQIKLTLSGMSKVDTDPRGYYIWLRAKNREKRPSKIVVGKRTNRPYVYTVEDKELTRLGWVVSGQRKRQENDYTQSSTLHFDGNFLGGSRQKLSLDIEDAGTRINLRWSL